MPQSKFLLKKVHNFGFGCSDVDFLDWQRGLASFSSKKRLSFQTSANPIKLFSTGQITFWRNMLLRSVPGKHFHPIVSEARKVCGSS
jgi:hypothetical protein